MDSDNEFIPALVVCNDFCQCICCPCLFVVQSVMCIACTVLCLPCMPCCLALGCIFSNEIKEKMGAANFDRDDIPKMGTVAADNIIPAAAAPVVVVVDRDAQKPN